jgi:serine/threonine protein kinase
MTMTPERWQRVKLVLEDALELPSEERSGFLAKVCSDDATLRQEVESFLALGDEEARTSFLQSSATHVTLPQGTKLGEYEVQSLLGLGGMGEVYRAHDLRLRRDVAIKVLPRFVSNDPERLRRFEQEARAAAALNHPNILAVFKWERMKERLIWFPSCWKAAPYARKSNAEHFPRAKRSTTACRSHTAWRQHMKRESCTVI